MTTIYDNLNDHELIARIKDGDQEAYARIYQQYFRVLFIHAYKKLQDKEEARDLIQELFTTLWTKRAYLSLNSSLVAYLYTAVRNRILDHYAHQDVQSRYVSSLQQFVDVEPVETDHHIREKELLEVIEKEIQALPSKMREIFELSRKSHFSHKEIAEQLGISEQTVAKQVSNALKILRTKLGAALFFLLLLHLK